MAKIYNDFQPANLMSFAKSFIRLDGQPLDKSEIWYNFDEAQSYAKTDAAYVGQILSVINSENNNVIFYGIQDTEGTLKEIGSSAVGDNVSLEVIDNVIQLKNFGKEYYAFVPAIKDENGNIIENSKYILTQGFKSGLEPRVIFDNEALMIAWYEPGVETIEDIAINIESISKTVDELKEQIGQKSNDTIEASGLYSEIERIDIELNDRYTKNETDEIITEAIINAEHLKRKIVDTLPAIEEAEINTIYMVLNDSSDNNNKYSEWIIINNVFEKVGSWEVDLTNYAKTEDLENISSEIERIDNTIISNTNEFNSIVSNINNSLDTLQNNKVDKAYYEVVELDENNNPILDESGNPIIKFVEGTLISPLDREKLDALNITEDGLQIQVNNIQGLSDWLNDNGNIYINNLTENNLSENLSDKINFITAVDNNNFIVENSTLLLNNVSIQQVDNLQNILNNKVDIVEGSRLINQDEIKLLESLSQGEFDNYITSVEENILSVINGKLDIVAVPTSALSVLGDFDTLPNAENNYTLIDEINNLYKYLTWNSIS